MAEITELRKDVQRIMVSIGKVETKLKFMPTTDEMKNTISTALADHRTRFCDTIHPVTGRRSRPPSNGGFPYVKIGKAFGALIGAAAIAAAGYLSK